jgi:cytochrome c oxidase cbb3-type subunit 4
MDAGILHGVWTAALLAVFAAIVAWAWSGRRKRDFDEAARLPLDEDSDDATESGSPGAGHG